MNRLDEPFALPSGISGTFEELKAKFQNNEITERVDLKALKREANARFETHIAGVMSAYAYYDCEVENFYSADYDLLENPFVAVTVEYLRDAAVIKGDKVVVDFIDDKMKRTTDHMLERCEFERAMLRCPHLAESLR